MVLTHGVTYLLLIESDIKHDVTGLFFILSNIKRSYIIKANCKKVSQNFFHIYIIKCFCTFSNGKITYTALY